MLAPYKMVLEASPGFQPAIHLFQPECLLLRRRIKNHFSYFFY